jgi:hypothetical protein
MTGYIVNPGSCCHFFPELNCTGQPMFSVSNGGLDDVASVCIALLVIL